MRKCKSFISIRVLSFTVIFPVAFLGAQHSGLEEVVIVGIGRFNFAQQPHFHLTLEYSSSAAVFLKPLLQAAVPVNRSVLPFHYKFLLLLSIAINSGK